MIIARAIPVMLALVLGVYVGVVYAQTTELRFVTWRSEAPEVWNQGIVDFERQNPGVKVISEIGPQSSTQLHDLLTQKLKNRDPRLDVFVMDVIWPAEFASAGWTLPLDRYFTTNEQQRFLDAPIAANRYRGPIFGVPLFIDAGLLYYRKDLLAKFHVAPPRTWAELVDAAKKILTAANDPQLIGYSGQFKQYEGLVCNMMEFILGNGGELWDEVALVSALEQPAARAAVRFVRDHIIGEVSHRGVLAYEEPESLALFTEGRAIFHRNWPYAWSVANDSQRSKIADKVGMAPLPGFSPAQGAASRTPGPPGIGTSTQPDDPRQDRGRRNLHPSDVPSNARAIARRTAHVILAEIGADMSRFATAGHLASVDGQVPRNNESAGKHRSGADRLTIPLALGASPRPTHARPHELGTRVIHTSEVAAR
jgi:ABC-type glycerol-3-phosphate transport system substrate-binding protein